MFTRVQNSMRKLIVPLSVAACVLCTVTPTSTAFSAAPAVFSLSRTQAHARKGGHTNAFRLRQRSAELWGVTLSSSSTASKRLHSASAVGGTCNCRSLGRATSTRHGRNFAGWP